MSEISVLTRSSVDESFDLFPVHVYAFFADGACADYRILEDSDNPLSFNLPVGNYTFYALAGAPTGRYKLPSVANASATSALPLADLATEHSELAVGRADVTIAEEENELLVLNLTRVVAKIDASVSGLPDDITGVMMSFNPLETRLLLNGTFDRANADKELSLTLYKEDGEWHTTESAFIFPSKAPVTIGIILTGSDGEKRKYSYNTDFGIEANYKYEISATYNERSEMPKIGGIVSGTEWSGEVKCAFNFGDEEPEDVNPPFVAGDIYDDSFYILSAEEVSPGRLELTLLYHRAENGTNHEELRDNIKVNSHKGLSGWTLITEKEARMINALCIEKMAAVNNLLKEKGIDTFHTTEAHLCEGDNGVLYSFRATAKPFALGVESSRAHARGMKKISVLYH
ncbi:MAG: FimB/Mfa2 family fimbrial subunit [Tannerellaceae bacterium]|nr:FimB/Mfa2 family fimbrial subunit [Tannerellaceae bacterium]